MQKGQYRLGISLIKLASLSWGKHIKEKLHPFSEIGRVKKAICLGIDKSQVISREIGWDWKKEKSVKKYDFNSIRGCVWTSKEK